MDAPDQPAGRRSRSTRLLMFALGMVPGAVSLLALSIAQESGLYGLLGAITVPVAALLTRRTRVADLSDASRPAAGGIALVAVMYFHVCWLTYVTLITISYGVRSLPT